MRILIMTILISLFQSHSFGSPENYCKEEYLKALKELKLTNPKDKNLRFEKPEMILIAKDGTVYNSPIKFQLDKNSEKPTVIIYDEADGADQKSKVIKEHFKKLMNIKYNLKTNDPDIKLRTVRIEPSLRDGQELGETSAHIISPPNSYMMNVIHLKKNCELINDKSVSAPAVAKPKDVGIKN